MSHYFTLVLVRPDTNDINAEVERLLEPFNENISVPEYKAGCYCVGSEARNAGRVHADAVIGLIEQLRNAYWKMPEEQRPEWEEHIGSWLAACEGAEKAHSLYEKPRPGCETCGGTGIRRTTYNPKSQWDWWRIGGRWDGNVAGQEAAGTEMWQDRMMNRPMVASTSMTSIRR